MLVPSQSHDLQGRISLLSMRLMPQILSRLRRIKGYLRVRDILEIILECGAH